MANSISIYKDTIEEEAQHTIGLCYPDKYGFHWSYVEFTAGTYGTGHVVSDETPGDLISSSGVGTVTTASAVNTNLLIDSGEFNGKDLRGAIGAITENAGVGQSFIVVDQLDDDKLKIQLLGKQGGAGWTTALATDSTYRLQIPGRVKLGIANGKTRGVWQGDEFTVPTGEFRYGFVRQEGIGEGLLDADGTEPGVNGLVVPAASGLVQGAPGTLTIAAFSRAIGTSLIGDLLGNTDARIPIDFSIQNRTRSFRNPRKREEPRISVS